MEIVVKSFRKILQNTIKKDNLVSLIFLSVSLLLFRYLMEHGFNYTIGNMVILISISFLIFICHSDSQSINIVNEYHMSAYETYSNKIKEKYLNLSKTREEHTYYPGMETIRKSVRRARNWLSSSIKNKEGNYGEEEISKISLSEMDKKEEFNVMNDKDNDKKKRSLS
jgi:hypothetical protein